LEAKKGKKVLGAEILKRLKKTKKEAIWKLDFQKGSKRPKKTKKVLGVEIFKTPKNPIFQRIWKSICRQIRQRI
jgi:hypothetical protein